MPAGEPYAQQVADDVHAYVQPDGGWCLNNAGIVAGDGEALLVDTTATVRRTEALRHAVEVITPAPVRTVVNTHHHGDHTNGNVLFADEARIIGHAACAAAVLAEGRLVETIWPHVEWGEFEITPPGVLLTEPTRLDVGGVEVQLLPLPPAHTDNDLAVWLPRSKVLFTGDLVFSAGTPFVLMGSVAGSLAVLDRFRELGATTIVPGHGPVCGPEGLDATENYLRWIAELAADGHARGITPAEVAQKADSAAAGFGELLNPERLVANLHRAYAELDGLEPGGHLELLAPLADMVTLNGGEMPACYA